MFCIELSGLVSRSRSQEDRRVVDVSLTDEGRTLVKNSPEVASNKITNGLETLSLPELSVIHQGLERLTRILDATDIPPYPYRHVRGESAKKQETYPVKGKTMINLSRFSSLAGR